jgi:PAS domain S-box-containing protein
MGPAEDCLARGPLKDEGESLAMKASYLSDLELDLQAEDSIHDALPAERSGVGILIADPLAQRLIEAAAVQLELEPVVLDPLRFDAAESTEFELIVAEEAIAAELRAYQEANRRQGERLDPALIAVRSRPPAALRQSAPVLAEPLSGKPVSEPKPPAFDALLTLPLTPAVMTEQLSLVLYAHRAFASRYRSALEELHLNRRIFRSVTSGISVANALLPDMPLVYVNPAFEVMTGYCLEEVQGVNCRFLQGDEHDQPAVAELRKAVQERREVVVVLKNYRKDGTFFWNELSLSPIRNREGEVTHFVGIQTDVTARVEFEAALRESEKLAAVGRLASSIAHEINNPLESVMNLLYLAQKTGEPAELREYLALAERELQRASVITSQSLRFYKQSTRPQAITCSELLKSVLDLYEGRAEHAHVAIEKRERSTVPVVCLESEIRQVLNNLVRNAIDAMGGEQGEHRGGRLLIRTREATNWRTGVAGVVITVADTGSGISPATMRSIYKAFFTTKGIAGTGLGLWISSEIVARHHGSLKVRSRERTAETVGGTVFELFLPLVSVAV